VSGLMNKQITFTTVILVLALAVHAAADAGAKN
jgi:hypothetical protein